MAVLVLCSAGILRSLLQFSSRGSCAQRELLRATLDKHWRRRHRHRRRWTRDVSQCRGRTPDRLDASDAAGVDLTEAFHIVNETTREPVENPSLTALREGQIVGLANHTILISKDGTEWPIDDSAAPITTAEGHVSGAVLVFREIIAAQAARSGAPGAYRGVGIRQCPHEQVAHRTQSQRRTVSQHGRLDSTIGLDDAARRPHLLVQRTLV